MSEWIAVNLKNIEESVKYIDAFLSCDSSIDCRRKKHIRTAVVDRTAAGTFKFQLVQAIDCRTVTLNLPALILILSSPMPPIKDLI